MTRPTPTACRRTYRRIQAHCAKRVSTHIGAQLRSMVGTAGHIADLAPSALAKFAGREYTEAMRLVALAQQIRQKYERQHNQKGN